LLNNYYVDINNNIQVRSLDKALFGNCIIYGNKDSEIILDFKESGFSFKFDHSLIRVSDDFEVSDPNYFENVIVNIDPKFKDSFDRDFELDTLSIAKDNGNTEFGIMFPLDINMQNRNDDSAPDIGAYERIETP
jgi:hypothetical protein